MFSGVRLHCGFALRVRSGISPFLEYAEAPEAAPHWSNLMYRLLIAGIGKGRWRVIQ
jgi:hypothetical protein